MLVNGKNQPVPAVCTIDGCDNKGCARQLCRKHYERLNKHGDPLVNLNKKSPCKIEKCTKSALSGEDGYCKMHTARIAKHGDPTIPLNAKDPVDKFWSSVEKTDTCWLWTSTKYVQGYGAMCVYGKRRTAHSYSAQLHGIDVPEGHELDHICGVRACVNPDHLRAVTRAQNLQNLGGAKSNSKTGELNITWVKRHKRFHVVVFKDRKFHNGGYFTDIKEAIKARDELRKSLFTHNDRMNNQKREAA